MTARLSGSRPRGNVWPIRAPRPVQPPPRRSGARSVGCRSSRPRRSAISRLQSRPPRSPAITASRRPRSKATASDSLLRGATFAGWPWQVSRTASRSAAPNGRAEPRPRSSAVPTVAVEDPGACVPRQRSGRQRDGAESTPRAPLWRRSPVPRGGRTLHLPTGPVTVLASDSTPGCTGAPPAGVSRPASPEPRRVPCRCRRRHGSATGPPPPLGLVLPSVSASSTIIGGHARHARRRPLAN